MESEEQKVCPNCKREIPAVNFTIHSVHCARNIKVCPVCKEPVPQAELADHHDKLHKLLPCKHCGEKVCGTDLEDHIRDSCGHTIKSCRYCSLELVRRDLPAHENYCGVRTEQCPECLEWVMIKYRQLHEDSNHGFLRLDDDPVPIPRKEPVKSTVVPKLTNLPKPMNVPQPTSAANVKNTNLISERPRTEIRYCNAPSTSNGELLSGFRSNPVRQNISNIQANLQCRTNETPQFNIPSGSRSSAPVTPSNVRFNRPLPSSSSSNGFSDVLPSNLRPTNAQNVFNGVNKAPLKRTNDQPQINTNVAAVNKVDKDLPISRGAIKKRPAPKPPVREPPTADPKRDLAFQSAMQRHQDEDRKRQEQNAYNLAHGLPPVLSAAAKLEKLRKMDALHNRETENTDYKNRLQGRVWMDSTFVPLGNVLGSTSQEPNTSHLEVERRRQRENRSNESTRNADYEEDRRNDFKDVKPMTPEQFMDRFKELQVGKDQDDRTERSGDRFSEIKSSLRELRRGLNEVTAPYNSNITSSASNSDRNGRRSPRVPPAPPAPPTDECVRLPCEFCGAPVLAHDLVQHQTSCRPDLTQYRRVQRRSPSPLPPVVDPVIPCEFCAQSLPVYLISEHQERCGREANLLYPD